MSLPSSGATLLLPPPLRLLAWLLAWLLAPLSPVLAEPVQAPALAARAWLLTDYSSRQVLAGRNASERIEPASMTKIMTTYVAFRAIQEGQIRLTDTITVSEKAWRTGGSRMFLEVGKTVSIDELLHGIIIQSGNDATVALAEAIAGSEEAFAERMNREAQRLGMKDSHFTNASGLPDPDLYSTMHDLTLLVRALIHDFPQYYDWFAIKEYKYNGISQPNRNRLLWIDPHVDGVKTGHTEAAGYCLAASAMREEMRLIAVVAGTSSENARVAETQKLLNYGFRHFETRPLFKPGEAVTQLRVWKGAEDQLAAGVAEPLFVTVPRGSYDQVKATVSSRQPLLAPVQAGEPVGQLTLRLHDQVLLQTPLVAQASIGTANIFMRAWDSLRLMVQD